MTSPNIACPFCGEDDFDLIGLKSHLTHGDCEPFNELPAIKRLFDLARADNDAPDAVSAS